MRDIDLFHALPGKCPAVCVGEFELLTSMAVGHSSCCCVQHAINRASLNPFVPYLYASIMHQPVYVAGSLRLLTLLSVLYVMTDI